MPLVGNNCATMRIQQLADQRVSATRIANEHAVRLDLPENVPVLKSFERAL
jgi:hypothetical protein